VGLGAAADLFIAAKAAEGASPRALEWYRMITGRAVRRFGLDRPVDAISAAELSGRCRAPRIAHPLEASWIVNPAGRVRPNG
jgi:hypothetical protein